MPPAKLRTKLSDIPVDTRPRTQAHAGSRIISAGLAWRLMQYGVDVERIDKLTLQEANKLHRTLIVREKNGLATYKQSKILKKHGLPINLTKEQASKEIDIIFNKERNRGAGPTIGTGFS